MDLAASEAVNIRVAMIEAREMVLALWVRGLWYRLTHDNLDVKNIRNKEDEVSNRDIRLVSFQVW